MSDADTPHLPDPLNTEATAAALPSFDPPAVEVPSVDVPAADLPSVDAPAVEVPAVEMPAPVPAAPLPSVDAPASSVVLGPAAVKGSKRGAIAWSLAAVATLAAGAFGVLWAGKSSDADKLSKDKTALLTTQADLQDQLDTATSTLATAQKDLDEARSDLENAKGDKDDLQEKVDDLSGQVDGLTGQVDELNKRLKAAQNGTATPSAAEFAPRFSLLMGQSIGDNADPPLNDTEATCLGAGLIDRVGFDALLTAVVASPTGTPTTAFLTKVGNAGIEAATACGLSQDRLGL